MGTQKEREKYGKSNVYVWRCIPQQKAGAIGVCLCESRDRGVCGGWSEGGEVCVWTEEEDGVDLFIFVPSPATGFVAHILVRGLLCSDAPDCTYGPGNIFSFVLPVVGWFVDTPFFWIIFLVPALIFFLR